MPKLTDEEKTKIALEMLDKKPFFILAAACCVHADKIIEKEGVKTIQYSLDGTKGKITAVFTQITI